MKFVQMWNLFLHLKWSKLQLIINEKYVHNWKLFIYEKIYEK
jgi:hypothetical protein